MRANGWTLYTHPLFDEQLRRLTIAVARQKASRPDTWAASTDAKLLAAIRLLVRNTIPADPAAKAFRQGGTLGSGHKHWFRAKFGGGRYRLFFRYNTAARIILFAWVNDETTLRTYGSKSDAYAVFRKMLDQGDPPDDWAALMAAARRLSGMDG